MQKWIAVVLEEKEWLESGIDWLVDNNNREMYRES
jgi:hypothetical protein